MSRKDRAISAVAELLEKRGAVRLDSGPGDWRVELDVAGAKHAVLVRLTDAFPYVRPKIYAAETETQSREKFLVIPHTNWDGTLCVAPDEATIDPDDATAVMADCLANAASLLNDWKSGKLDGDFHDEANAFWPQDKGLKWIRIDFDPDQQACIAYCWATNGRTIHVAATEARLRKTCAIFGLPEKTKVGRALFFPLTGTVNPKDYPDDASQLADFLKSRGGDPQKILELLETSSMVPVIMRFSARPEAQSQEPIFLSLIAVPRIEEAPKSRFYGRKRKFSGFRPDNVPASLRREALKHHALARVRTERIDRGWLHFRGGAGIRSATLFTSKVCVIGCGSLGSEIAMLLVREGVKNLDLIDDDKLSWDNVGRHRLGAVSVDRFKVDALADLARNTLPDVVVRPHICRWQDHPQGLSYFRGFDLVINATGEWSSNAEMNVRMFGVPVLYTWTEPRGAAGHALLVTGIGGCLGCGFDRTGVFAHRVLRWSSSTLAKLPGCGGSFQPYSLSDTIPIAAMAIRFAIDRLAGKSEKSELRSWINLPAAGDDAVIEDGWLSVLKNLPSGVGEFRQPWNHAHACDICA